MTRTGDTSTDLVVYYDIHGSAENGVDYATLPGSVVIPVGQSSATIDVDPIDDALPEGTQTVHLFLTSASGYRFGDPMDDFVWIADDDGPDPGPSVDLIAYRPRGQHYHFERTPVPAATENTVGAGVRSNGDDDNGNGTADWAASDTFVSGENDLVDISLDFGMQQAPAGINYYLRRSNTNVKVWKSYLKEDVVLDAASEQQIVFSQPLSLWVEWVYDTFDTASTTLTFEARDAQTGDVVGTPNSVRMFRFTSVVIMIGGRNQWPTDPPDQRQGVFVLGRHLYATHAYDVHMFPHSAQARLWQRGTGLAYDEVVNAVNNRRVRYVPIVGYSWGGGATYNLADRLHTAMAEQQLALLEIPYTAYIDAIVHGLNAPQRDPPPLGTRRDNYYQSTNMLTRGVFIESCNVNVDVNTTPWGANLDHRTIDDDVSGAGRTLLEEIRDAIIAHVVNR